MIIRHDRHIFGEIHEVRKGLWALSVWHTPVNTSSEECERGTNFACDIYTIFLLIYSDVGTRKTKENSRDHKG